MDTETVPLSNERRSLWNARANHYFIPSSYQAYRLLHVSFVILPIAAGLDKFFHLFVNWNIYLSPRVTALGVDPTLLMYAVGAIEVIAGILVAFKPRVGGMLVMAWLWAIVLNLLSIPGFYDIAVRDFFLSLGALALSMLSLEFQQYRQVRLERWSPLGETKEV